MNKLFFYRVKEYLSFTGKIKTIYEFRVHIGINSYIKQKDQRQIIKMLENGIIEPSSRSPI